MKKYKSSLIASLDLTRSGQPDLWFATWDPSQPTATRPLAIQKDGTWFTYGYDITKNVCEVFGPAGYIRTAYSYAPFGNVSSSGDVSQPFQWSSEHDDSELGLVYYNFRHYSPDLGRFLSRDPIEEKGGRNLYAFVKNAITQKYDVLGRSGVSAFLFKIYLSRAILGEPSEPIIFSDINNEMKYASQSSIWSELKKYLGRNAQGQKKRQKIQLSELNIASLTSNKSLAVTTNGLHLTVSSSSTVLVSGDLSFCVSDEGVAFDMDGIVDVAWVDEMDANSFREFYYKEIKHGGGWSLSVVIAWLIEGSIDLLGDSLLGANFDFVIHYQMDLSKFS